MAVSASTAARREETKHTPGPWSAEFIARACSAHDELVMACQRLIAQLEDALDGEVENQTGRVFIPGKSDLQLLPDGSYLLSQARAALAKATGAGS